MAKRVLLAFNAIALIGAALSARADAGYGPNPVLPAPNPSLIPTVNIAPVVGWPDSVTPQAARRFAVSEFAAGLDHPRWLHVLPNGDVLAAESNAPAKHDADSGLKGVVMRLFMARAAVPSADRISLLRGVDGKAKIHTVFLENLHSPFGMALIGDTLYVANTDAIMAFPYVTGQTQITERGQKIFDLPAGPINHHWTKDIIASPDGALLFVTVGSNSNAGENGMAAEEGRKFHWKPKMGLQSVLWDEAVKSNGADADRHRRDLWDAIDRGDYPEWDLGVQLFDQDFAAGFAFDVLDPTKLIPEEDCPVQIIGTMKLDRAVENFFAETEQVAFCTANVIPGIDFTDDPLLQGRNFSYLDTQIKRLGGGQISPKSP